MRKWTWPIVVLIAVVVPAGGGGLWVDASPAQAADNAVQISDEVFTPAEITVAPGTTITWSNTSQSAPHSAKAQDGSFDTGYIMPGAQGQASFDTPGDYQYFCEPHPNKKGVVHVK
jgi:plastocyanin